MNKSMRMSEAVLIGFHAAALLAERTSLVTPARFIAETYGISGDHLVKVLQRMAKAGLVNSIRGPQGGYMLAHPPRDISLLEVYEAVEGPFTIKSCIFGYDKCFLPRCIFQDLHSEVQTAYLKHLSTTTLDQLTAQPKLDAAGSIPDPAAPNQVSAPPHHGAAESSQITTESNKVLTEPHHGEFEHIQATAELNHAAAKPNRVAANPKGKGRQ